MSFAPPADLAANEPAPRLRNVDGTAASRALSLAAVVLAHVAGLVAVAYLARHPAPVPEVPISVALIELPRPLPMAPPTPPAPPKQAEPPPPPKPRPRPAPPAPVPVTQAPSAIRSEPAPAAPAEVQPREAPREAPAAPPASAAAQRPAPEAPPAVVAARFDAAYLNNPAPSYPPLSRRMREEGKVLLRVQVSADGLPEKVELAESSGFPRLDSAAREAVQRWRFVAAKQGGQAVAAAVIVPIVFKLEGN